MHREELVKKLVRFGFTKDQAKIYLAGLILRHALMAHLARIAGVKRSSAYYLMSELLRRGFFEKKKMGKRMYYMAASPAELLKMTRQREKMIKRLLPALRSL